MKRLLTGIYVLLLAITVGLSGADAASTKKKAVKRDSKSNYTAEQRSKLHLQALELCRKKYGRTNLHHVEIDYARRRVKCWIT